MKKPENNDSKFLHLKYNFFYMVFILSLLLIFTFAYRNSHNKDLVSIFTFGLTLTSFVVSVLAIVYSFVTTSNLSHNISSLDTVIKNSEDSSKKLKKISGSIEKKLEDNTKQLFEFNRHIESINTGGKSVGEQKGHEILEENDNNSILPLNWIPSLDTKYWNKYKKKIIKSAHDMRIYYSQEANITDSVFFIKYIKTYNNLDRNNKILLKDDITEFLKLRKEYSEKNIDSRGGSLAPLEYVGNFTDITLKKITHIDKINSKKKYVKTNIIKEFIEKNSFQETND
jgi:hypothetical protein